MFQYWNTCVISDIREELELKRQSQAGTAEDLSQQVCLTLLYIQRNLHYSTNGEHTDIQLLEMYGWHNLPCGEGKISEESNRSEQ